MKRFLIALLALAFALPALAQSTGGGGGGGGAITLIQTVVTAGSQNSVTFNSIPSSYRDIEVIVMGRGDNASQDVTLSMTVNGLSTSIYSYQRLYAFGTSVAGDNNLAATSLSGFAAIPGASAQANQASYAAVRLFNYANTTFWKTGSLDNTQPSSTTTDQSYAVRGMVQIDTTAAISSLTVSTATGNFVNGSVVSLYGIGS